MWKEDGVYIQMISDAICCLYQDKKELVKKPDPDINNFNWQLVWIQFLFPDANVENSMRYGQISYIFDILERISGELKENIGMFTLIQLDPLMLHLSFHCNVQVIIYYIVYV